MAVSHQSGVIENHWNDPPATTFSKPPTPSTTPGLPTPPQTPGIEGADLVVGLDGLLALPSNLAGRNREMIFGRVRGLIKALEEGTIPGTSAVLPIPVFGGSFLVLLWLVLEIEANKVDSQRLGLEGIIRDIQVEGKSVARERIVKFMAQERGIAAWATALRMVIENIA
jgi:hypothetical protein